jgi:hypothetical protein
MSDTPKKDQENAEQSLEPKSFADSIGDLPEKSVTDQEAQSVKGGHSDDAPTERKRL